MAVSCGLLSADWGNVADWVAAGANWATFAVATLALLIAAWGVVVSVLGAAAVAYLGWQANSLASSAVRHEQMRSKQDDALEASERRMLLVAIHMSLGLAAIARIRALRVLKRSSPSALADVDTRQSISEHLKACVFDLPESVRSRLHLIGEPYCSMIVRAQTTPMALQEVLNLMAGATLGADEENLKNGYRSLVGGLATGCRDIDLVLEQCAIAAQQSGGPPAVKAEEAFKVLRMQDDE